MSVHIGLRWRPGHRVFRNDETGEFGEVNSPLLGESERLVQSALLRKPRRRWLRSEPIPSTTERGSHDHHGTDDHGAAGA